MSTYEKIVKRQPAVTKQLQLTVDKNRVAHAYLFEGPKGSGKGELAIFFAKLLFCESPNENVPCETCRNCRRLDSGNHPNFQQLSPDGQFIKKDQVQQLIYSFSKTTLEQGKKIYVIHQADRMNASAANALLKFLEEPTSDITAILLTEQASAILPTIRSRTMHISLKSAPREQLIQQLIDQGVTLSMASTVSVVSNEQEDAYRLANEESFAQLRKTVLKLGEAIESSIHEALLLLQLEVMPILKDKQDVDQFIDLLLYFYRDLVAVKANPEAACTFPDQLAYYRERSIQLTYDQLSRKIQFILEAKLRATSNMNRTLLMEQLLLNLQEGLSFA